MTAPILEVLDVEVSLQEEEPPSDGEDEPLSSDHHDEPLPKNEPLVPAAAEKGEGGDGARGAPRSPDEAGERDDLILKGRRSAALSAPAGSRTKVPVVWPPAVAPVATHQEARIQAYQWYEDAFNQASAPDAREESALPPAHAAEAGEGAAPAAVWLSLA